MKINVFQPSLGDEEAEAVRAVMRSSWIGRGEKVREFEAAWAAHIGVPAENVVATTCATEGLFLAARLYRWHDLYMPAISFVGAANAVCATLNRPYFMDVNARTLMPDTENYQAIIESDKYAEYERLRAFLFAFLITHYGGRPPDYSGVPHNTPIIEDCAGNPLAKPKGEVAVWSFDAMKIISTGDGGMIYFRSRQHADWARQQINLGLEEESGLKSTKPHWWEFDVAPADKNARRAIMNDITAAIGLEQLKKLPTFIARRKQIHETYNVELASEGWLRLPPVIPDNVQSSYYNYWVQTETMEARDRLARHLRGKGIYTTFRYHPLHRVKAYGQTDKRLPGAEWAADHTLLLPLHQSLSDDDVARVVRAVKELVR